MYEKARGKLLKYLASSIPETDEYWQIKTMQQELLGKNKQKIEAVMEMPYEKFQYRRNSLALMKKMGQPLTQEYLNNRLIYGQDIEEIKQLISAGADITAKDKFGKTALMNSATMEKTKFLIEAGADINVKDNFGCTALMETYSIEKSKLLIEAGADINQKTILEEQR